MFRKRTCRCKHLKHLLPSNRSVTNCVRADPSLDPRSVSGFCEATYFHHMLCRERINVLKKGESSTEKDISELGGLI